MAEMVCNLAKCNEHNQDHVRFQLIWKISSKLKATFSHILNYVTQISFCIFFVAVSEYWVYDIHCMYRPGPFNSNNK